MSDTATTNFYRTRLPHWEVKRGLYFVTMHVKGSLPQHVIEELEEIAKESVGLEPAAHAKKQRDAFRIMEKALHDDRRIDYLVRREASNVCIEAIQHRHSTGVWKMIEYVLMPNHIHLFFHLTSGTLRSVMIAFKRWTSEHARESVGPSERYGNKIGSTTGRVRQWKMNASSTTSGRIQSKPDWCGSTKIGPMVRGNTR